MSRRRPRVLSPGIIRWAGGVEREAPTPRRGGREEARSGGLRECRTAMVGSGFRPRRPVMELHSVGRLYRLLYGTPTSVALRWVGQMAVR